MKKIIYKLARFFLKLILPIVKTPAISIGVEQARKNVESLCEEREIFLQSDIVNLEVDESIDLSIIIPVYNSEKLLRNCMDSIINQKTKYHFEIIAINDGSTDNSLNILKEYSQVKVMDKKNEGVAIARNVGLDVAKGKYVAFIDSDDEIHELYVEKLLNKAFEKNADVVKCNYIEYSVSKNEIIKWERHKSESIKGKLNEKIVEFKGFVWGGIYKRELWSNVRFLPAYWYEDMIIRFIVFRKCERFEYINEDLYRYNNHSNNISKSISKTKNLRCLDHLFLVKHLLEMSETLGLEKDVALYKILLQELGSLLWLRTRDLSEKVKRDVFIMACDIIEKHKIVCNLEFGEKYLEKSFETKSFILWKLCSIYMMLGVKMGN